MDIILPMLSQPGNLGTHNFRAQARLSAVTTTILYVYSSLDLSVTNLPAGDVYRHPFDLRFAKPKHDDDIGVRVRNRTTISSSSLGVGGLIVSNFLKQIFNLQLCIYCEGFEERRINTTTKNCVNDYEFYQV